MEEENDGFTGFVQQSGSCRLQFLMIVRVVEQPSGLLPASWIPGLRSEGKGRKCALSLKD